MALYRPHRRAPCARESPIRYICCALLSHCALSHVAAPGANHRRRRRPVQKRLSPLRQQEQRRYIFTYDTSYKQRMLNDMRGRLVSPIPLDPNVRACTAHAHAHCRAQSPHAPSLPSLVLVCRALCMQSNKGGAYQGKRAAFTPHDPKNEVRLGGTRPELPSYESERLLNLMERSVWEWPNRPKPPPRGGAYFVEDVGRLEPLIAYGGKNAYRLTAPGLRPTQSLPALDPKSRPLNR